MDQISVPSMLSKEGVIADSSSMCFGHERVGRISFWDQGSPDQEVTPFNLNPSYPAYNITVTEIQIGTTLVDIDFTALFDSGTSFTYLLDPTYTTVSAHFHSQAKDSLRPLDPRIPFEHCYDMSPNSNASLMPGMRLTMNGGGHFSVSGPIIVISTQTELVYCLAVVKGTELNIIGRYDIDNYNKLPTEPHASSVPPAVAAGLGNYSSSQSTKEGRNESQSSVATPYYCRHCYYVISFIFAFTLYNLA